MDKRYLVSIPTYQAEDIIHVEIEAKSLMEARSKALAMFDDEEKFMVAYNQIMATDLAELEDAD